VCRDRGGSKHSIVDQVAILVPGGDACGLREEIVGLVVSRRPQGGRRTAVRGLAIRKCAACVLGRVAGVDVLRSIGDAISKGNLGFDSSTRNVVGTSCRIG
jgi:hypothetical protein